MLVFSITAGGWIIFSSWDRYDKNPIVVTVEKNWRDWFTPMIGGMICLIDRLNYGAAERFIRE